MGQAGLGPASADVDPGPVEFSPGPTLGSIAGRSIAQSRSRSNPNANSGRHRSLRFGAANGIISRGTSASRNTAASNDLRSNCPTRKTGSARTHLARQPALPSGIAHSIFRRCD
jgi:hypothetical protein